MATARLFLRFDRGTLSGFGDFVQGYVQPTAPFHLRRLISQFCFLPIRLGSPRDSFMHTPHRSGICMTLTRQRHGPGIRLTRSDWIWGSYIDDF